MGGVPQIGSQNDNKGPQVIGAQATCIVLAFLGVAARFSSRSLIGAGFRADDWLTLVALVLYAATTIEGFICVYLGAGRHEETLSNPGAFSKASFAFIILYRPAIAMVKFSVLFLYRRIFPQAGFRRILSYYGYFVLLYTVVFLVLDIFHCRPVSQAWHSDNKEACLNMDTIWIVGGSLNAVTDIAALCLPMPLLWRLNIEKEKRIQLMGVFLLGGFVCVVSIIRVIELGGLSSTDESYVYSTTLIWSTVEVGVGIFSACLPVARPILTAVLGHLPNLTFTGGKANHHTSHIDTFPKQGYRLNHHGRNNTRLPEVDDQEPLSTQPRMEVNVITGHESFGGETDVENGVGAAGDGIAVTTKIEQEFNHMPRN